MDVTALKERAKYDPEKEVCKEPLLLEGQLLQCYIDKPMLWNNRKIDMRMHAAIASFDPLLIMSYEGRFIYAGKDYVEGKLTLDYCLP